MSGKPQPASAGTCARHGVERAAQRGVDCGEDWCADRLLPPVRKRQPLRCFESALVAAGVRTGGARAAPMSMNRPQRRPTSLFYGGGHAAAAAMSRRYCTPDHVTDVAAA